MTRSFSEMHVAPLLATSTGLPEIAHIVTYGAKNAPYSAQEVGFVGSDASGDDGLQK
jgi:hypothetical protein